MQELFNRTLKFLEQNNPSQFQLLQTKINKLQPEYFINAERQLSKLNNYLINDGKDFNFGLDCYNKKLTDVYNEYLDFLRTGKYRCSSFEEVNQRVYSNPKIMEYHTVGLIFFEIVNPENFDKLLFFKEQVSKYKSDISNYLEIGGGHGLYTAEAYDILNGQVDFDFLDISDTSIKIAKHFLDGYQINFITKDIFLFDCEKKYDFISLGSVLEHVEEPLKLLIKIKSLMKKDGKLFLTVPANDPTIDHIYLFNNINEIKELLANAGFQIIEEKSFYRKDLPTEFLTKYKLSIYYSSLVEVNN